MTARAPQVRKILEGDASPGSEISLPHSGRSHFLDVPDHIKHDQVACQIFREVTEHLSEMGQLARVDAIMLSNYAIMQSYFISHYRETGSPITKSSVLSNLRAYAKLFGLDPFDRASMAVRPGADEESKADRLRRRMAGDE